MSEQKNSSNNEKQFQLQISGNGRSYTFIIPQGLTKINRQDDADLQLYESDQVVSRSHAQIERDGDICTIMDVGSSNGTKVNGIELRPHQSTTLQPGDSIEILPFTLVFEQILPERELEPVVVAEAPAALPEIPAPIPEIEEPQEVEATAASTSLSTSVAPTPPPPPIEPPDNGRSPNPDAYTPPPGLDMGRSRYLNYLPDIYDTPFMGQFLALFESIYAPVEWTAVNFDLFLSPATAPADFLPWLANWFDIIFDETWSEDQRRTFLLEAHELYGRNGTPGALARILEIYTGCQPKIDDSGEELKPFTFEVTLPQPETALNRSRVEQLINHYKPAHTNYRLQFQ